MAGMDTTGTKGRPAKRTLWDGPADQLQIDLMEVDHGLLTCAMHVAMADGYMFTIASAQGGRGLMLSLYKNKVGKKKFPMTLAELTAQLWGIIDALPPLGDDQQERFVLPERPD